MRAKGNSPSPAQRHSASGAAKTRYLSVQLLYITLVACAHTGINAQPIASFEDSVVFLGGQITVGKDGIKARNGTLGVMGGAALGALSPVDNKAFSCTPVHPLKEGDVLAAKTSNEQSWSTDKVPLSIGTHNVTYPIMGLIARHYPGKEYMTFWAFHPTVLKAKIDIKPGVIHSGGYAITVTRPVKSGDSIPAICDGFGYVLSAEAAEGADKSSEAKPWFTAFKEGIEPGDKVGIGPDDIAAAIEAWRIEREHVGK